MPKQYKVSYNANRAKVYFAIRDFWERNNYAPTHRDIVEETGLIVSVVHWHVSRLREFGVLEKVDSYSRNLIIAGTEVVLPPIHDDFLEYYQEDNDKDDVRLK